ncbi:zinc finger, C2H2 type family protein (macronuclear) [Tetrahymena thermophila SB210]|uniref:Zinc finger, C2H2 type family protein n=1 Tax=Tetrahymena thermophila (strain SB210) TaxID=312017 RepID=Q236B1_TETTS|nr:zinc finger, C2H2 type family protein [Tetrahymena thermophila SB210]EAR92589.1 zinc finger, C2H2 type family protein [Tetrahymena thermophila SB210]|eukprot:XP_001012834.1 zinc finger, C2H2 type family protein [Tetrahymena thermophila SB210]
MVKQTKNSNQNQKIHQTDSVESSDSLSKEKQNIFTIKKTKRRSVSELKDEKQIVCPMCKDKKYASFPALYTHIKFSHHSIQENQQVTEKPICKQCNRKCSSISSLKTHMKLAHDQETKEALQKTIKSCNQNKSNEKKPPKGRPPKAIQEPDLPDDFEMIDDIDEKYQILNIFQNENFISVLQNVMFTEGYLCRNHQTISCQVLTKEQMIDYFNYLKNIFKIEDSLDWLNDQVYEFFKQLNELIFNEAFIIIYYSYHNEDYENLLQISKDLKQDNCDFNLIHDVLIKETLTEDLKELLIEYFKDLHLSLQTLINDLQNFPNQQQKSQLISV